MELATLENEASRMKDGELVLIMRYTGAHPSALLDPRYKFEEYHEGGTTFIRWLRPKKTGREAYTIIPKAKRIANINVNVVIKELQSRKRRCSRQYLYELCRRVGEAAGIPGVSPMTLRHTLAVDLLSRGMDSDVVRQTLNVSHKTLRTYAKFTTRTKANAFEAVGW